MIRVESLSFSYGKRQILKNISLSFETGKLYAIVGPNGCGKTTLLNCIAGLRHKGPEVTVDGKGYFETGRAEMAKKLAILPQSRPMPSMTVSDLVTAGRYPYLDLTRKPSPVDREAVRCAMEITDTQGFADRRVKELSGGERQRVYVAMLLAQDTPYVLLDEPTSHLDVSCTFEVMRLLKEMRDGGKCVIAVLHDLSSALKYADLVAVMGEGEILSLSPPVETVDCGVLERVFGVRCTVADVDGKKEYIFSEK